MSSFEINRSDSLKSWTLLAVLELVLLLRYVARRILCLPNHVF